MHNQPSVSTNEMGAGLLGCLGGAVIGLIGGLVLLIGASLMIAAVRPAPAPPQTPPNQPDLQVTLEENFLNRFAEQPAEGQVVVNILPGNQVQLTVDTTVDALGLLVPVQLTGLFQVQLAGQTLQVNLLDTRVSGISIPLDLSNVFSEDTLTINQELSSMVTQISQTLGVPIMLTGLATNDTQIQIDIREAP